MDILPALLRETVSSHAVITTLAIWATCAVVFAVSALTTAHVARDDSYRRD